MTDPARFVEDLVLAKEYSLLLMETFNRMCQDAITRMGYNKKDLPIELRIAESAKTISGIISCN
jgi:hypothetical protein